MWLLNTVSFKLHNFLDKIPEYVILSHTWDEGEVTFYDFDKPHVQSMPGYSKIVGFCALALRDGYEWGWVDTCCIDKRSSAALSEAINSMYSYYWQAAVCYAYLADFNSSLYRLGLSVFKSSRWFTRGWTLQELLAPEFVEFYNKSWEPLGTKSSLVTALVAATKIEEKYLMNRAKIRESSIGTRFSWVARRETTRVEDLAYCMLGLVDINMPMLYGEGHRAFHRLQLEIIRRTSEHSIFAWEPILGDWQTTAMLAPSPSYFKYAARTNVAIRHDFLETSTHEVTNNGLRISLPVIAIGTDRVIAVLDCRNDHGARLGVWLEKLGDGRYQRQPGSQLAAVTEEEEQELVLLNMFLPVETVREEIVTSATSELSVSEVQSDGMCFLNGIMISTRAGITMAKGNYLYDDFGDDNIYTLSRDQFSYLHDELVIGEGEAACFRLGYGRSSEDLDWISVVFGLHKNRALIRLVDDGNEFRTQWSDDMRIDATGLWDSASDFILSSIGDFGLLRAHFKKRLSNGHPRWALSVFIHGCSYQAMNNYAATCCCRVDWIPAALPYKQTEGRCRKKDILENYCQGHLCVASRPEPLRKALMCSCIACNSRSTYEIQNQRRFCDHCKQISDKHTGKHYVECPCGPCCKESRIEVDQILAPESNEKHYIECQCGFCRQDSKIEVFERARIWPTLTDVSGLGQTHNKLRRIRSAIKRQLILSPSNSNSARRSSL